MSDSSVKVAVRVRPFNGREKDMGAKLIIRMSTNGTVWITNPEDGKEKEYGFDYAYWSHDGMKPTTYADEYMTPDGPNSPYDDQNKVFNDLGVSVLNNAFDGYHVCLFAYGQTGSGKSYSMTGYGENKGILPRACAEIFRRVRERDADPAVVIEHTIELSMIEIYNEKVQDLLVKPGSRNKDGLQVREHPKTGVYVQDARFVPVASYEEIESQVELGTSNRTIGATNMNATSSRAHTVVQIRFTQKSFEADKKTVKQNLTSNINLIDLAGSERSSSTGATGDRLAEGNAINQSLSALGLVIKALADKAAGKAAKNAVVPYRSSKLTYILKPFLGGNAKTAMIAALSPASVNYDETLGTLRYAFQVKAIKNAAVVNESPQEKQIRELKEMVEALKAGGAVATTGGGNSGGGGGSDSAAMAKAMKEQEELMAQMATERAEFEAKLAVQQKETAAKQENELKLKTCPQIRNLNADPALSGTFKFAMNDGDTYVGKRTPNQTPDIQLSGVGIGKPHCVVNYDSNNRSVTLAPNTEDYKRYKVMINGVVVEEPTRLNHGDRILIGSHFYYLYVDPMVNYEEAYDYDDALKEANKDSMGAFDGAEYNDKLKEMEDKIRLENQQKQMELDEMKKQIEAQKAKFANNGMKEERAAFEEKMKAQEAALEEERRRSQDNYDRMMKEKLDQENRMQQFREIEIKLSEGIPKIAEMNTIAKECFREGVFYEPHIQTEVKPDGSKVSKMMVRVYPDRNNIEESSLLPWEVFNDKVYFEVKELYETYEEKNFEIDETTIDKDDDGEIFGWSLSESWHHIGSIYYFLLSVYNLIDIQKDETPVIDSKGAIAGKMNYGVTVEVLDTDRTTKLNVLDYESLQECVGKYLRLTVDLRRVVDIPEKYTFKTKCKYQFLDQEEPFETKVCEKMREPQFDYKGVHESIVTEELLQKLMYNSLTIGVYGMIESKRKDLKKKANMAAEETNQHAAQQQAYHPVTTSGMAIDDTEEVPDTLEGKDIYIENCRQKNKELMVQLEAAQKQLAQGGLADTNKTNCCNLF